MKTSHIDYALKVGDEVIIGGQSRHKGSKGIIEKMCRVRVGVKLTDTARLVYLAPHNLSVRSRVSDKKTVANSPEKSWKFTHRVAEGYLIGCEILEGLSTGKSKVEARLLLSDVLEAWSEAKEEIVRSLL